MKRSTVSKAVGKCKSIRGRGAAALMRHVKFALIAATVILSMSALFAGSAVAQTGTILKQFTSSNISGMAVAYRALSPGLIHSSGVLYFTLASDSFTRINEPGFEIYKENIFINGAVGLGGKIPNPAIGHRYFDCGALAWDPNSQQLWCGVFGGSSYPAPPPYGTGPYLGGRIYTINPATGNATYKFTTTFADSCFGGISGYITGLAFDPHDSTLWLSDAGGTLLHHYPSTGPFTEIPPGPYTMPINPNSVLQGCNDGIAVVPNKANTLTPFLVLALMGDYGLPGTPYPPYVVSVEKSVLPTIGTSPLPVSTFFPDPVGNGSVYATGLAFDQYTFEYSSPPSHPPKCALWSNNPAGPDIITAWQIKCPPAIP
jgi:hypothetical protein